MPERGVMGERQASARQQPSDDGDGGIGGVEAAGIGVAAGQDEGVEYRGVVIAVAVGGGGQLGGLGGFESPRGTTGSTTTCAGTAETRCRRDRAAARPGR